MTTYSEILHVLQASAVTSIARATSGTITIPAGKRGRVFEIGVTINQIVETIVNAGGLIEIECDAIDWKPLEFIVTGITAVTEGGDGQVIANRFPVDLVLPAPCTITVYYTPYDNVEQAVSVDINWETGAKAKPNRANHIKGNVVLKASAVSAITTASAHNTITIPNEKGGRLLAIDLASWPTLETVVDSGGKVKIMNTVENWAPFNKTVPGLTSVGASGGGKIPNERYPVDKRLPGNSTVTTDYTPYDDQSQSMSINLLWRGKEPK